MVCETLINNCSSFVIILACLGGFGLYVLGWFLTGKWYEYVTGYDDYFNKGDESIFISLVFWTVIFLILLFCCITSLIGHIVRYFLLPIFNNNKIKELEKKISERRHKIK